MLAWYDHYLKGIDTGIEEQPPVRYWLQGANQWRTAQGWPIPGAKKQRCYLELHADNAHAEQDLQTAPPAQESSLSFVAIPRHMLYPKVLDRYEAQVLRYATRFFQKDTEVTGPIRLQLRLASTAIDTHIIARVSDVAPEELSRPDEIIHEHRNADPLTPGEPVIVTFSLTPTSNLFRKGHRLLLEIASQPDLLETNAFEGFIFFPYDAPPYPARNTIFHGGSNPSYIEWEVCNT